MPRTAKKTEDEKVVILRYEKINPRWMMRDRSGPYTQEYLVYLPQGVWLPQLREDPTIWAHVQRMRPGLRQFDKVRLISFERHRFAEATIIYADQFSAKIDSKAAQRGTIDLEPPSLQENDVARITLAGPYYGVQRKTDGVYLKREIPTFREANDELAKWDTTPVER